MLALLVFLSTTWMVWKNYKPFLLLEEKTAAFFSRVFGQPEMTYQEGFFNGLFTFLVTYASAPYLSSLTVLLALVLFLNGKFLLGLSVLAIMSTGGILGIALKNFFKRPRPENSLSTEKGYSFPSGHAIATSLFFLIIIRLLLPELADPSLRIMLTILLSLTCFTVLFSRLYFHAHHLGDIIVGFSYAILWVQAGTFIYHWLVNLTS